MKKTMFAATVMAIVMLVATSAMAAHNAYYPMMVDVSKCDHKIVKIVEFERQNDDGSYDISDTYYYFYANKNETVCNCVMELVKFDITGRYMDQDQFESMFKGSEDDSHIEKTEYPDGSMLVIDRALYRSLCEESFTTSMK